MNSFIMNIIIVSLFYIYGIYSNLLFPPSGYTQVFHKDMNKRSTKSHFCERCYLNENKMSQ